MHYTAYSKENQFFVKIVNIYKNKYVYNTELLYLDKTHERKLKYRVLYWLLIHNVYSKKCIML